MGLRRRDDVLRVAVWRLHSDSVTDPTPLVAACGLAWAAHDMDLAVRLGWAALDAGGGVVAAVTLGTLLHFAGRSAESEAALRRVAGEAITDRERALVAVTRARNLHWGLGRGNEAHRVLDEAMEAITDLDWCQEVLTVKASCHVLAAQCRQSLDLVARVRAIGPMSPRVAAQVAAVEGQAFAFMGRTERCVSTVDAALATAESWRDEVPHTVAALGVARMMACLFAGDLGEAEALAVGYRELSESGTWDMGFTIVAALRGQICRLRGEVHSAIRWCHEATVRFGDAPAGFAGLCFGELAHAAALAGDAATAEGALAEAGRRSLQTHRAADYPAALARPWVLAARGDVTRAIDLALTNAAEARALDMGAFEMFALHDVVRLGAPGRAAGRLAALAEEVDGALAPVFARHAHAAMAGDGTGLDAVAEEYEKLGLTLYTAEAAAQAAAAHEAAGHARHTHLSSTRAWTTARRCQGARTPALAKMATPELTSRQRQIIQLAVTGLSNREIAEHLGLSVRTVGNHLVRAYERLGVSDRAGLADLFGPRPHPPATKV
jgi:DNA-binding CsgD family transcriptional regulator